MSGVGAMSTSRGPHVRPGIVMSTETLGEPRLSATPQTLPGRFPQIPLDARVRTRDVARRTASVRLHEWLILLGV
jgi:hypothetical protein